VSNRLRSRGLSTSSSESRPSTAWAAVALAGIVGFHPSPDSSVDSRDSRLPFLDENPSAAGSGPTSIVRVPASRVPRQAASFSVGRRVSSGVESCRRGQRVAVSWTTTSRSGDEETENLPRGGLYPLDEARSATTDPSGRTTLHSSGGAGITAAAGTRLALLSGFENRFGVAPQ